MRIITKRIGMALATFCVILAISVKTPANTRTLETRFSLSADARSEFSTSFPLISAGRIIVDANWRSASGQQLRSSLTLMLIEPNGSTVVSKSGISNLQIEHQAAQQNIEPLVARPLKWTVKIINDARSERTEVSGTLRITIPATTMVLEDTQFTLLGSGNAQEIAFNIPAPGRIEISVTWQATELLKPVNQTSLIVSLIHPGESKTYARRQGTSPVGVDQQITDESLDSGGRWIVRIQNGAQTKVGGRVRINYTPGL